VLVQGDALRLPFADKSFDVATVSFGVRNFEDLAAGLKEIRRVLHPEGRLVVLEFGQPGGLWGFLYQLYSKFFMPIIGGVLTGNFHAYRYLPKTAEEFPCGDKFSSILNTCGYSVSVVRSLSGGIAYLYVADCSD
jgi:demethylmenaquinone methyltransferase/2-methoxy-6-polyprenyl-1,4-benzoquinol methylase